MSKSLDVLNNYTGDIDTFVDLSFFASPSAESTSKLSPKIQNLKERFFTPAEKVIGEDLTRLSDTPAASRSYISLTDTSNDNCLEPTSYENGTGDWKLEFKKTMDDVMHRLMHVFKKKAKVASSKSL